jgi:hypothetical protein
MRGERTSGEWQAKQEALQRQKIAERAEQLARAEIWESRKEQLKSIIHGKTKFGAAALKTQAIIESGLKGFKRYGTGKEGRGERFRLAEGVSRPSGIRRVGTTGRYRSGRPKGTFDPRYGQYGGVYGYRRAMAGQRRIERLRMEQALARATAQGVPIGYQREQIQGYPRQGMPQQMMPQQPLNAPEIQQMMPQERPAPRGLRIWDSSFSMVGPPLNSPNDISLVGSGGLGFFTPFGDGQSNPMPLVQPQGMATPFSNPMENTYLDVDMLTGRQVVKRRW